MTSTGWTACPSQHDLKTMGYSRFAQGRQRATGLSGVLLHGLLKAFHSMGTVLTALPDSPSAILLLVVTMPSVLDSFFFPITDGFAVVFARELIRLSFDL